MSGEQQSPINLPKNPFVTDFGAFGLRLKWQKTALGRISKDDHGVRVTFSGDQRQFILLGRGREQYHLVEFHFHHPSEHWIDGKQQLLELHIVHQNPDSGNRVVLGVFIEATHQQVEVPDLFGQIKQFVSDPTTVPEGNVYVNPYQFVPTDVEHCYRYEGSLTTKPFDENVSWVVFKDPLLLPTKLVKELIVVFRHPARLPQPLCRRLVLANFLP